MHSVIYRLSLVVGFTAAYSLPSSAFAQSAGYIAGTAFGDIRQFGATSDTRQLAGTISRNGTAAGGSIRVGTWLHPRWSLEAGVDLSSKTTGTFEGPVIAIFPPVPALNLTSSTSYTSVTTMVGFHSGEGRHVRLGYRVGFSFMRETYRTDFPDFRSPSVFFEEGFANGAFTGIYGITRSTALSTTSLTSTRNAGALTVGFEAAIDLTSRLSVVPEIRASTFSIGSTGAGIFLIRPGVGGRWKF